jgi:NAD(P)-dependent dehydrogenase (short-subunit alcohol dehydrogenase family)
MKTSELFDVAGLATIVTGAASGIGYAYAEAMADNGDSATRACDCVRRRSLPINLKKHRAAPLLPQRPLADSI